MIHKCPTYSKIKHPMRPRVATVYVDKTTINQGRTISLNAERSHYLCRVMRCKKGDTIEIVDGQGGRYEAVIQGLSHQRVVVAIAAIRVEQHPYMTILCQALIKGDWMDELIQQVTELGIKEVYPIITERTIPRYTKRLIRWSKIAEQSIEQCGRSHLPIIHEPITVKGLLELFSTQNQATGIIFSKASDYLQEALLNGVEQVYLAVGPEGGFTDTEVSMFLEAGFIGASLGRFTLRAKNAAPLAVALTHYFLDRHKRGQKF